MVVLKSTDGEKNLPRYFAQSFGVIKKLNNGTLDVSWKMEEFLELRAFWTDLKQSSQFTMMTYLPDL